MIVHLGAPDGDGASFSECMTWRYLLWRSIGESLLAPRVRGTLLFIMLNPSTADESANDPTVAGCLKRADAWGYRRLEVCNLFALRSTDPEALYAHDDPVGPENDDFIMRAAVRADTVICAWGGHGALQGRGHTLATMLRIAGIKLAALRVNLTGHPSHPLYLPHRLEPSPWAGWAPHR